MKQLAMAFALAAAVLASGTGVLLARDGAASQGEKEAAASETAYCEAPEGNPLLEYERGLALAQRELVARSGAKMRPGESAIPIDEDTLLLNTRGYNYAPKAFGQ